MRAPEPLAAFVHAALAAGRGRDEIAAALAAAGWSRPEIGAALSAWADAPPLPPVPRPRGLVSPWDALVHGIMFLALGLFATQLGAVIFALIELWVTDPLEPRGYTGGWIRSAVAIILVAYPLWAWLALRLARQGADDPGARRSAVVRWLTAGALFLAAAIVLGDAIALVERVLGGELTPRFLLKAITVATIAGAVFVAYLPDAAAEAE